MPHVKKHATNAQRQAAYRQRMEQARMQQLTVRSLPPLPAIPSMPGAARWTTSLTHAQHLLESTAREMERYYDDRSEAWQESDRGCTFLEQLQGLQELLDGLQELSF